jgi:hypothetical protein
LYLSNERNLFFINLYIFLFSYKRYSTWLLRIINLITFSYNSTDMQHSLMSCWPFNICFVVFLCAIFIFRFPVNKTNWRTEFQCYWYYDSTRCDQSFCRSSGVLSRTSALVHFMQIWLPFAIRSSIDVIQFHPAPDSKR